jgi:hypothetical protein
VHVDGVLPPDVTAQLAQGFQEGLAFDVPDRAAHLDQDDVDGGVLGQGADAALDLVGDVGNDLDGAAQ